MKLQANVWSTLTTPLTLPQNARLLIERRLLRLSTDCRATLSTAALLGRYFNSSLLCKACQRDEIQVAGHLDDAIQAHILLPLDASLPTGAAPGYSVRDADVAFTHDRLREVLAQSLNPLRRRVIQRQVAQAIEQHYAAQLQAHYSKLAYHYQQADAGPQALDYLMKAAQQAINVYAFVDAADFLEQAVKLLQGTPDQPQRAELLRQLSTDIYLYTGELEKAISTGIASCDLWQELGDGVKEARSCLDLAFAFHWMNQEANAHAYISRALERLSTHPEEKHLLARAHVQWGLIATTMGDAPAALEQLQESDELLSQLEQQDPFILVVSLWSYTWCAYLSGTPRHMLAYARRSIEVCRETRMFGWEPMMTYSAAWAQMLLGDIEGGKQTGQEALTQSIRYNVVGAQGWSNLVLAFLATNEDDWAGADGYIADTLEIADMLRNRDLHSRALWCKSISAGRQGRWEEALVTISSGLQVLAEQNETSMVHPHIELQAATAYFQLGKFREAQRHLATCMDMAQRREYQQLPALALRLRGLILQTQQRHTEAQASFEQSLQRLTALEDTVEYKRTQEVYRQLSPFHSL